jgi:hypothetical protein
MKKKKLLLLLLLISVFSSCFYTDCIKADIRLNFVGFTAQEASPIIVRRFAKANNFASKIDSTIINFGFRQQNDTLSPSSGIPFNLITSDYDYEVFMPIANKTFQITEIIEPQSRIKKSIFKNTKEACGNLIISYNVNNRSVFPALLNIIYLTK